MLRQIHRLTILVPMLIAAGPIVAAAQGPIYSPELPIWGIYASGNGYVVNSPEMAARAAYEGISIECFKTMTVTVMPSALIAPDTPENYWLARSINGGLIEIKAEGLNWFEAQRALHIYSPYKNLAIICWPTVWTLGDPSPPPPPSSRDLPGNGWDRRSLSGTHYSRVQRKYYGVQRTFEQLTWTVQAVRGFPEGFMAAQEQEFEIRGWVSPNYNPALNSAEGVNASLRCIGKCQFLDPTTKRSLGGWLRWRVDRLNPQFHQIILIRSTAGRSESFEIEFAVDGMKTVWPYRPRE